MVEIGEVIGLLATKIKDDNKKVHLVAKCKNDENKELRSLVTDIKYNNDDGTVMISNLCDIGYENMAVKKLISTLFMYQSDSTAAFVIYDKDGKSEKKLVCSSLPRFADMKVYEHDDIVEIVILVDNILI